MSKVLIVGASADLASDVLPPLIQQDGKIGLHYAVNKKAVEKYEEKENVKLIQCTIQSEENCKFIIDEYVSWAGGIDRLVIFLGNISTTCYWTEISAGQLENEYRYNAVYPLILAKYAQQFIKSKGGGENSVHQHSFCQKGRRKYDDRIRYGEGCFGMRDEKVSA